MAIIYDHPSFMRCLGYADVTESLDNAVEEFCRQMDDTNYIDEITFKHKDYKDVVIHITREPKGYLVRVEDKDFTI